MHEFEGKTVEEAIQKAVDTLNLSLSSIDVEILEEKKGFFGSTRYARIKVTQSSQMQFFGEAEALEADSPEEQRVIDFIHKLLHYFDVAGKAEIQKRKEEEIEIAIHLSNPSLLIGKNGNTFDALQTIVSAAAHGLDYDKHVYIDIEQYHHRRTQRIIGQVKKVVQQVRRTKNSVLLQPMNAQQRRVVHKTVASLRGVSSESKEQNGSWLKRVEIFPDDA